MRSTIVGEAEILALTDVEGPFAELRRLFPGVPAEEWAPYMARYPWVFADGRTLRGRVGAYLVRAPGSTLLVDTGIGPGTMGMRGRLWNELEETGVRPEDVDTVFLTHLHGDHVGWSLSADGEPAFPNARYVTQEAEWEDADPHLQKAMSFLDRLGVLELIRGEEAVTEEFVAIPTPGHSRGHSSLLVYSGGEQALIVGDVIVNPAQVTEPTWSTVFDADRAQAAFTRAQLLDWLEADGIVVAAGHIPGSGFGRVVREGGERYWETADAMQARDEEIFARGPGRSGGTQR